MKFDLYCGFIFNENILGRLFCTFPFKHRKIESKVYVQKEEHMDDAMLVVLIHMEGMSQISLSCLKKWLE